jgi:hypothetical protein
MPSPARVDEPRKKPLPGLAPNLAPPITNQLGSKASLHPRSLGVKGDSIPFGRSGNRIGDAVDLN